MSRRLIDIMKDKDSYDNRVIRSWFNYHDTSPYRDEELTPEQEKIAEKVMELLKTP